MPARFPQKAAAAEPRAMRPPIASRRCDPFAATDAGNRESVPAPFFSCNSGSMPEVSRIASIGSFSRHARALLWSLACAESPSGRLRAKAKAAARSSSAHQPKSPPETSSRALSARKRGHGLDPALAIRGRGEDGNRRVDHRCPPILLSGWAWTSASARSGECPAQNFQASSSAGCARIHASAAGGSTSSHC